MSTRWRVRSVLVSLVLVLVVGLTMMASPVSAASRTSVTLHARVCPEGTLTDLYADCHDNANPGQVFQFGSRVPKTTNDSGNVSFSQVPAGYYTIWLVDGDQPSSSLRIRVFCSDVNVGAAAKEAKVRVTSGMANFNLRVNTGQRIVCDVYYIPR